MGASDWGDWVFLKRPWTTRKDTAVIFSDTEMNASVFLFFPIEYKPLSAVLCQPLSVSFLLLIKSISECSQVWSQDKVTEDYRTARYFFFLI